jgi:CysZ protein
MLLALAVYVALGVGLWALVAPWAARQASAYGLAGWLGGAAASLVVTVAWVLLFSTLFVALAGVVAGFMWDPLSAEVERLDGGDPPPVPLRMPALVADSVARLAFAAFVAVTALLMALFIGPFAGWAAAGFLGLLDYSAPAALRRGWTLRRQMGRVLRPASLPFALVVGVVSLIPLVNLLLWPASVAGGTLLVRELSREE